MCHLKGSAHVCGYCGLPVVCDRMDSLPQAACVVVEIVSFKLFRVSPFGCSDGLLQPVPDSLILLFSILCPH